MKTQKLKDVKIGEFYVPKNSLTDFVWEVQIIWKIDNILTEDRMIPIYYRDTVFSEVTDTECEEGWQETEASVNMEVITYDEFMVLLNSFISMVKLHDDDLKVIRTLLRKKRLDQI